MAKDTPKNYEVIKRIIREVSGQANILTIPRLYLNLLGGDHRAALVLSQCVYLSDAEGDEDGWFCRTFPEWLAEVGVPKGGMIRCFEVLKRWVASKVEHVAGAQRSHYRVDMDALIDSLLALPSSKSVRSETLRTVGTETLRTTERAVSTENGRTSISKDLKTERGAFPSTRNPRAASILAALKKGEERHYSRRGDFDLASVPEHLRPLAEAFFAGTQNRFKPRNADDLGFWLSTWGEQYDAELTPEDISGGIFNMLKDGTTMKSPASITTAALNYALARQKREGSTQLAGWKTADQLRAEGKL